MSAPGLDEVLEAFGEVTVAVSGGVDSLTLAVRAARRLGTERTLMMHAASPAVPAEATARVRELAAREGWRLEVVDAGEFADPRYRSNPVNRCFFCKTNLYDAIAARTARQILSGANLDDLGEYRPGLDAAREHNVRHPYIEAGMDKAAVRALARALGLPQVAALPASPCLSSRVETGLQIDAAELAAVHEVERWLDAELSPQTVRCRVRARGVVIELDAETLDSLGPARREALGARVATCFPAELARKGVGFSPYRSGSAFLVAAQA